MLRDRLTALIAIPLLLLTLVAVGCQGGPRPAAEFVQQAEFLHTSALAQTVVKDRDVSDYFNEIGKRIIAGATAANASNTRDPTFSTMKFHLVSSDVVNAFGTGGGHIYIYDGLLQFCETEEELATLMAVQFAHALDLDIQRTGMKPDVSGTADRLAVDRVAFLFVTFPLSGSQALEADKKAFDFYTRAGWDPARFADAYGRLRTRGFDLPSISGGDGKPRIGLSQRFATAAALRQSLSAQAKDWWQPTVADTEVFKELKNQARTQSQRVDPALRGAFYLTAFPNVILPADLPIQQQYQAQLRKDVTPPAPPTPKIEPN